MNALNGKIKKKLNGNTVQVLNGINVITKSSTIVPNVWLSPALNKQTLSNMELYYILIREGDSYVMLVPHIQTISTELSLHLVALAAVSAMTKSFLPAKQWE